MGPSTSRSTSTPLRTSTAKEPAFPAIHSPTPKALQPIAPGWLRNEASIPVRTRTRTQPEGRYSYSNQHAPNRTQFHPLIPSARVRVRVRVPPSETHGAGTRISGHPLPNAKGVAADSPGLAEERGPPGVQVPNDPRTLKAMRSPPRCRGRHRNRDRTTLRLDADTDTDSDPDTDSEVMGREHARVRTNSRA
jgi:hypothetical protein